jgi:addiction module RelE/StbE family toxin
MFVRWTEEALENLWEIETFIGRDNPKKAEAFVNSLIEKGESVALNPRIGRRVPEISHPDFRELIVQTYRIVYRVHKKEIEILTVFEGHKLARLDELDPDS